MRTLDGLQMATWLCTHMAQRALCLLKAQCYLIKSHKPDEITKGGIKVEKRSKSALGSSCLKYHSSQVRVLKCASSNRRSAGGGLDVLHF